MNSARHRVRKQVPGAGNWGLQMPEVLVENYNVNAKRVEYPRQEIRTLSVDDIQRLLDGVNAEEEQKAPVPVRVVTENYIVRKFPDGRYQVRHNMAGYVRASKVDQARLRKLLGREKKVVIAAGFLPVFAILALVAPVLILYGLSVLLEQGPVQDPEITYTIFGILAAISGFSAIYAVRELIQAAKGERIIPLKRTLPYVENFLQWDVSLYVFLFLQAAILLVLPFLVIYLGNIVVPAETMAVLVATIGILTSLLFIIIVFGGPLNDYFLMYREERQRKERIQDVLVERITSGPADQKAYLLTTYQLVLARRWFIIGKLPKLLAFLSFVTPVITTFIQLLT
jgi:hypothetical protein